MYVYSVVFVEFGYFFDFVYYYDDGGSFFELVIF